MNISFKKKKKKKKWVVTVEGHLKKDGWLNLTYLLPLVKSVSKLQSTAPIKDSAKTESWTLFESVNLFDPSTAVLV